MFGLLVGCAVGGVPAASQMSPYADFGATMKSVKGMERVAEPALRKRPAPGPGADPKAVERHRTRGYQQARLKYLLEYQAKVADRVSRGATNAGEMFNLLQASRDLIDSGCRLAESPWQQLAWQAAGLRQAEVMHALAAAGVKGGWMSPQAADQTTAQVELFKAQVVTARGECLRTFPRLWR